MRFVTSCLTLSLAAALVPLGAARAEGPEADLHEAFRRGRITAVALEAAERTFTSCELWDPKAAVLFCLETVSNDGATVWTASFVDAKTAEATRLDVARRAEGEEIKADSKGLSAANARLRSTRRWEDIEAVVMANAPRVNPASVTLGQGRSVAVVETGEVVVVGVRPQPLSFPLMLEPGWKSSATSVYLPPGPPRVIAVYDWGDREQRSGVSYKVFSP
jgi:hypothetical protein